MLSWAILSKVAPARAVEPPRLLEGLVDLPGLTGALWEGDEFAHQVAARAQALGHLPVQVWVAPAESRLNRAVLTLLAAGGLFVRSKMISRGSLSAPRTSVVGRGGITPCWAAWSAWPRSGSSVISRLAPRPICACG